MRILLTNILLGGGSGTETAILDLAVSLRRRGHTVICFAPTLGHMATRIRATGTPVIDSVERISEDPEIIHGHHNGPTMIALARFPDTPALFVCHDWSSIHDDPPLHPRIMRYLYVRHVLRERLVSEKGIAPSRVAFFNNCVDLDRIGPPRDPPPTLRSAGVYAHPGSVPFVDMLAAACRTRGIEFHGELLAGAEDSHPESALARCDLVFASGRMAIEALLAGCAVINADRFGIGGLVTAERFDEFLAANFAIGALSEPASERLAGEALAAYTAADAAAVLARARRDCDARRAAERIEGIYEEVIAEHRRQPSDRTAEAKAFARYLEAHLQNGALYNGEVSRRRLVPEPGDEIARAVEVLSVDVRELTGHTRRLEQRLAKRPMMEAWQSLRNSLRK